MSISEFCRQIITGGGGFHVYEDREVVVYATSAARDQAIAAWTIRCLANVHYKGSQEAVQAIQKRRAVDLKWLDAPDGAGWWAFSGKVNQADPIRSEVFELREIDGELIAFGCEVVWPASMMNGKWLRLDIVWPE